MLRALRDPAAGAEEVGRGPGRTARCLQDTHGAQPTVSVFAPFNCPFNLGSGAGAVPGPRPFSWLLSPGTQNLCHSTVSRRAEQGHL